MEEIVRALVEQFFPPEQSLLASSAVSGVLALGSAALAYLGTAAALMGKRLASWSLAALRARFRPPELVQELLHELARPDAVVTGTGILTGNAEALLSRSGITLSVLVDGTDVSDRLGRHSRTVERLVRRRIREWQELQGQLREINALACLRPECLAMSEPDKGENANVPTAERRLLPCSPAADRR